MSSDLRKCTMRETDGQRDPRMQVLRDLQNEAGRLKHERYTVEEAELVRRAMDLGAPVETVVATDVFARTAEGQHLLDKAEAAGLNACSASAGLLGKMLGAKPTPDCVAIVRRKLASLDSILKAPCPLIQMVEHCESADNLGMLLRSTDAAGTTGVLLTADTTDPFSRRTVRGSRGAIYTVPLCIVSAAEAVFAAAKRHNIRIIGTSATATTAYDEVEYTGPVVIVVGNEHTGLSPAAQKAVDVMVRIPMRGRIHSLNIAVAASIMLYEAVRQRERQQRS
ncbi:MAG: RNA methyltransferase [bacterium]